MSRLTAAPPELPIELLLAPVVIFAASKTAPLLTVKVLELPDAAPIVRARCVVTSGSL